MLQFTEEEQARIATGAGMRLRAVVASREGGYGAGAEGFCLGPSKMGADRLQVLFDNGKTANPLQSNLQLIFQVGMRVMANSDSPSKVYKAGQTGFYLGMSDMGLGRASVIFEHSGKVENPMCNILTAVEEAPVEEPPSGRRVLFLQHGNIGEEPKEILDNTADPCLTDTGRAQASSWAATVKELGAEVVLMSPLRRTVETACLAFEREEVTLQLCNPARERWWDKPVNQLGSPQDLQELLVSLPRGNEVTEADAALVMGLPEAKDEEASVKQLLELLKARLEATIVVVCHFGVIMSLCKVKSQNAEIVDCILTEAGDLKVCSHYPSPWATADQGMRIRALKTLADQYKEGDEGYSLGKSAADVACMSVLFDSGNEADMKKGDFRIVFKVGCRVKVTADSSDNAKYYKIGDVGVFQGASPMGEGRAMVTFDRTGETENPPCKKLEDEFPKAPDEEDAEEISADSDSKAPEKKATDSDSKATVIIEEVEEPTVEVEKPAVEVEKATSPDTEKVEEPAVDVEEPTVEVEKATSPDTEKVEEPAVDVEEPTVEVKEPAVEVEKSSLEDQVDKVCSDPAPEIKFQDSDGDSIALRSEDGQINEYVNGELVSSIGTFFEINVGTRTYRDPSGGGAFKANEDLATLVKLRNALFQITEAAVEEGAAEPEQGASGDTSKADGQDGSDDEDSLPSLSGIAAGERQEEEKQMEEEIDAVNAMREGPMKDLMSAKVAESSEDEPAAVPDDKADEQVETEKVVIQDVEISIPKTPAAPVKVKAPSYSVLMFPGQGSQYVKMMSELKDNPVVKGYCEIAERILGYDILSLCLFGPEAALFETSKAQPAMFLAGMAGLEKLKESKPHVVENPGCVAGLSLGEYTALCVAGVFTFEQGLQLVKVRAEAMLEAGKAPTQAMLSVAGLEQDVLEKICKEHNQGDEVAVIANALFPKGFACSGTLGAIQNVHVACMRAGALQARVLKTSGACHSRLMDSASHKLEEALRELLPQMKPPMCDVYMNATGERVPAGTAPEELVPLLCQQLTGPVLWEKSVRCMIEDGMNEYYEIGPMKQLRAMMKRIDQKTYEHTSNIDV